jgi:hypothetical protein
VIAGTGHQSSMGEAEMGAGEASVPSAGESAEPVCMACDGKA